MKDDFEKLLTLLEQSMKSDDNESLSQLEKLIKNLSDNLKNQLEEPNTKKSLLNKDDLEKLRILLEKKSLNKQININFCKILIIS